MRVFAITTWFLLAGVIMLSQSDAFKTEDLDEDYAIYSEVLRTNYVTQEIKHVVIGDHTMMDFPSVMMAYTEFGNSHEMKKIRRATANETFRDYEEKNRSPIALENRFSLKIPVVLLSVSERDKVFGTKAEAAKSAHGPQAFQELNRLYPNSQGFMSLSRIGFSRTERQALVYIGNVCGGVCGTGRFFLLVKEGGAWKIKYAATAWVS